MNERVRCFRLVYMGAPVKLVFFRFAVFLDDKDDEGKTRFPEDFLLEQTNWRVLMAHRISPWDALTMASTDSLPTPRATTGLRSIIRFRAFARYVGAIGLKLENKGVSE